MMHDRGTASLLNFFVFNSTYGPREGEEHKKILYYYPPDTDVDIKIKNVGLCEAVVKFTETFTDKPCESMHTQKTRQVFFQPEQEFWIIMTVGIPCSPKTKDGQTYTEYHEEDVHDSVMSAILRQAYKMFRLFMGTFYHILEQSSLQGLKQRLEHFYSRYLLNLQLGQCDLVDVFNGISFLPLDKNTYLRIQCFINGLESSFPPVRHTIFMYNDSLVWSGLEQEDMRVLFGYLTTTLFPANMEQELKGSTTSAQGKQHYGMYITGPSNLQEDTCLEKVPHVFLTRPLEECQLLVYKALSATICMLLEVTDPPLTLDFFRRLDSFLGPQLSDLASDIGDQYSKRPSNVGDPQFKYLYFNHMNLAEKSTVHCDRKKTANLTISVDMLRLMADVSSDLEGVTCVEDGETLIKASSDCWLVAKKSDQREFYVVLNNKNANLIEINEEVKKVCATHFSNIFFLD